MLHILQRITFLLFEKSQFTYFVNTHFILHHKNQHLFRLLDQIMCLHVKFHRLFIKYNFDTILTDFYCNTNK